MYRTLADIERPTRPAYAPHPETKSPRSASIRLKESAETSYIMPTFQAVVKAALSGDTVVLHAVNNPSQERILNLAAVTAPRLRREGEEVSVNRFTMAS